MSKTFAVLMFGHHLPFMVEAERFDFYSEDRSAVFFDENHKTLAGFSDVRMVAVQTAIPEGVPRESAPVCSAPVLGYTSDLAIDECRRAISDTSLALRDAPFWRRGPLARHLERLLKFQADQLEASLNVPVLVDPPRCA